MRTKFRILLIDDNKEVLDRLKSIVQRDVQAGDFSIKIEVETLHVVLEQADANNYKVTDDTIKSLSYCCNEKFDYIFSDFGFIGSIEKSNQLRTKLLETEKRGVIKSDFKGNVLQLSDIKTAFEQSKLPEVAINKISSNFFRHTGKILIYTNSPEPYKNYFESTEIAIRRNEVKDVFNEVVDDVHFILMHEEFGINPEMEKALSNDDAKKKYFAIWLSNYIDHEMQFVALQHMVVSQGKLRFKNVEKAFQYLTAIAVGIGAVTAMFGEAIFHFFKEAFAALFTYLNWHFNETPIGGFALPILLTILAMWLLPKYGVYVAKKTEDKINKLL